VVAPDGAIWYITGSDFRNRKLWRQDEQTTTSYTVPLGFSDRLPIVDQRNHLWYTSQGSLWRMAPTPTFALLTTARRLLATPGQTLQQQIHVESYGGYGQSVSLTAVAVAEPLTVTINPSAVTPGGSATIAVTSRNDTAPGDYGFTLLGHSATISDSLRLTVTVAAQIDNSYLPLVNR
jgi:hypothetical protein